MTYMAITNGADDRAQIDLGDFDHDDVWQALADSHPDLYDMVTEDILVEITEVYDGSDSEITTPSELDAFLNGYRFEVSDGNTGYVEHWSTMDSALDDASDKWGHLSHFDEDKYRTAKGAVFMVTDCKGRVVRDWLDERMAEDTKKCRITAHGNALSVSITELARHIGADRGDLVEVTIRRVD